MDFSISSRSTSVSSLQIAEVAGKVVDQKQPLSISSISGRFEAQVLMSRHAQAGEAMTSQQLNQHLETSGFSESESQAMMGLFLATVVQQEKEGTEGAVKDPVGDLLSFDPAVWEKHIGVLVASIVALNIARKSSAEMSGKFTQMAYEAAIAQGVAIMAGGEAAMWAAVSGAVVATTMAVAGAGLSLRGQSQKHTDIKINQSAAAKFDAQAHQMRVDLEIDPSKRAVLESKIREAVDQATQARMKSALQAKTYEGNLTVGGAISSMAMIISSGLSAILRLQEYSERQREVLHQSEQGLNKAVSDVASQSINEYTTLLSKTLDAIQQLVDSRGSTMNAIASVRA
ncbi:IpaC/SipC family type III secretion system effector [Pseudomonas monteilii]|uniref:IpaC/SipC family type III secretion system effector n=1 Tax=Pseudomonas monteilii TaxID=76759 RepID=UPI001F211889|nr:IpaC/SipC family type III secretion system effector [Pseudomonas monteilii]